MLEQIISASETTAAMRRLVKNVERVIAGSRAAGAHGGAPGHGGGRDPSAAGALSPGGHGEPARVPRDVSVARGPAGPVHHDRHRQLSGSLGDPSDRRAAAAGPSHP